MVASSSLQSALGDAQDVKCSADQVWEPVGKPYEFSVPEARYSELKVDESSL